MVNTEHSKENWAKKKIKDKLFVLKLLSLLCEIHTKPAMIK